MHPLNLLGSMRLCVKSLHLKTGKHFTKGQSWAVFLLTSGSPSNINLHLVDTGGGLEGQMCAVLRDGARPGALSEFGGGLPLGKGQESADVVFDAL